MENGNVVEPSFEQEERAYNLLLWACLIPAAPYSEELASTGFYTQIQRKRSDEALDAFDRAKGEEPQALSELDAFRKLEELGIITQQDLYSPAKASNGFYSTKLKEYNGPRTIQNSQGQSVGAPGKPNRRNLRKHR